MKNTKNHGLRKAAGHNSVPPKQTILLCIRVAHGLPPWKIVCVMFFNWVLLRHHIFWEMEHFWEFYIKETNWENKKSFSKGKCKGNVKKQNHLRKQLDTIVYPQTNHTIVYHDHSCFFCLAETNPLESLWLWFQEQWS